MKTYLTPHMSLIQPSYNSDGTKCYDIFRQDRVCITHHESLFNLNGFIFTWPVWNGCGTYGLTQEEVGQLMGGN